MAPMLHIALALWVIHETPRRAVAGVQDFADQSIAARWTVDLLAPDQLLRRGLAGYDGVIGFFPELQARRLAEAPTPIINLSQNVRQPRHPAVACDPAAIGRLAAHHLLQQGAASLIYVGIGDIPYALERQRGFRTGAGATPLREFTAATDAAICHDLDGLPRPIGAYAPNDGRANRFAQACITAGMHVPDTVAVLGTEDTDVICRASPVALSSVAIDGHAIGHAAATLLERWILTGERPRADHLLPPAGVTRRQSTEILPGDDFVAADAVRLLRARACAGITVEQACLQTGLSRRTLERRVRALLGHGPHAEIQRVRLDRARHLLQQTAAPVAAVARRCGFGSPEHFTRLYKATYGASPRADSRRGP